MPSIIDPDLPWATLTEIVNNRPSKQTALRDMLFSNVRILTTEHIQIDALDGDRSMAPFILKNGEAVYVRGTTGKRHLVEGPNIRIKRAFESSMLMSERRLGTGIYPTRSQMVTARQQYIRDELDSMMDKIDHREEWMASQALRGVISYISATNDSWKITFPRPATHNTTAGGGIGWDEATGDVVGDILAACETMAERNGLTADICILGKAAHKAFRENEKVQKLLDTTNYEVGALEVRKYRGMGMLRLGRLADVEFWAYPRTLPGDDGNPYPLIRDNYAEFIHLGPGADNVAYYAAIADADAGSTGIFEGRVFSKSWKNPDPSGWVSLVHTRPLFVPRRPEAFLSMQVTGL